MMTQLKDRGFVVEAVLLRSIALPAGLTKAIEEKLAAKQDAQRRIIEAEGTRDAQKIINEGLVLELNPLGWDARH